MARTIKLFFLLFLTAFIIFACEKARTPPSINNISIKPDSIYAGDTVTISITLDRKNIEDVTILWECHTGELIEPTEQSSLESKWVAPQDPGDHYIYVQIGNSENFTKDSICLHVLDVFGILSDHRDGRWYNTVKIDKQVWMADNLGYLPEVSPSDIIIDNLPHYFVYGYLGTSSRAGKDTDNYARYGVLYSSGAALSACPEGWHLPTDEEWQKLEKFLGMSSSDINKEGYRSSGEIGYKLKSAYSWFSSGNGSDIVGFRAFPSGSRDPVSGFSGVGVTTYFWTASQENNQSWHRQLTGAEEGINRSLKEVWNCFSVRCIKDDVRPRFTQQF